MYVTNVVHRCSLTQKRLLNLGMICTWTYIRTCTCRCMHLNLEWRSSVYTKTKLKVASLKIWIKIGSRKKWKCNNNLHYAIYTVIIKQIYRLSYSPELLDKTRPDFNFFFNTPIRSVSKTAHLTTVAIYHFVGQAFQGYKLCTMLCSLIISTFWGKKKNHTLLDNTLTWFSLFFYIFSIHLSVLPVKQHTWQLLLSTILLVKPLRLVVL